MNKVDVRFGSKADITRTYRNSAFYLRKRTLGGTDPRFDVDQEIARHSSDI